VKVLLDTCVISEIQRPTGDPRVKTRVDAFDADDIFLSVVTIAEVLRGIELLPPSRRRDGLHAWIRSIEARHHDRILPVGLPVARLWGELDAAACRSGVTISTADGLIAATARHHGLTVVTRNTAEFRATGVPMIDPWEA